LLGFFLLVGAWGADEAAERAAIAKTIAALSVWPVRADLFTADFDGPAKGGVRVVCPEVWWETCGAPVETDSTQLPGSGAVVISKEPWGEAVWIPAGTAIRPAKIRFLTPEVATVDAVGTARVFLVMKKEGTEWKIASLRVLAER
jgi:hypothetical protein